MCRLLRRCYRQSRGTLSCSPPCGADGEHPRSCGSSLSGTRSPPSKLASVSSAHWADWPHPCRFQRTRARLRETCLAAAWQFVGKPCTPPLRLPLTRHGPLCCRPPTRRKVTTAALNESAGGGSPGGKAGRFLVWIASRRRRACDPTSCSLRPRLPHPSHQIGRAPGTHAGGLPAAVYTADGGTFC